MLANKTAVSNLLKPARIIINSSKNPAKNALKRRQLMLSHGQNSAPSFTRIGTDCRIEVATDKGIRAREDTKNKGARMSAKRRTRKVLLSISFEYKASFAYPCQNSKDQSPKAPVSIRFSFKA